MHQGIIKENGEFKNFLAFTDNIGSILSVIDEEGRSVFDASYDAWGRQTVTKDEIGLRRGYTGHEMLNGFGIINMNGRLYDPLLGRFLSPDNYVQAPDNSQSFNRYSYCLNNPLKYNDPSGEFWHLVIGAAIGGVINWALNGGDFNAKGLGYFATGAAAGALSAGIGAGVSSALPIAGQVSGGFAAGFLGTSTATTATSSFVSGALIGGSAGFAGGLVTGFGNSLVSGNNLGTSLAHGVKGALIGGASGAAIGGLWSGFDAMADGRNFWHGGTVEKEILVQQNIPIVGQEGQYNCLPASAEAIDKSFGGNMTQQDIRKMLGGDPNTVPLEDLSVWNNYTQRTGYQYGGQVSNLPKSPKDILTKMLNGNRVSINLNTGDVGHNVVMQKIVQKSITKINGNITRKLLFYVMDPARGGHIRRITENAIKKSYNVIYIYR